MNTAAYPRSAAISFCSRLLTRKAPIGPEIRLAQTLRRSIHDTMPVHDDVSHGRGSGLPVNDSSDVFDQSTEPYFIDVAHLNEAGNRRLAARITEIAVTAILAFPCLQEVLHREEIRDAKSRMERSDGRHAVHHRCC